jgi:hypothetical protein
MRVLPAYIGKPLNKRMIQGYYLFFGVIFNDGFAPNAGIAMS